MRKTETNAEANAEFHLDQIDEILIVTQRDQNVAWTASVQSAIAAMEDGIFAKLFKARVAKEVLRKAAASRQAEPVPNNRWYISSLVESLATLRIISLCCPARRDCYQTAKHRLLTNLPR